MDYFYRPDKQGLYDPSFERDACGVGFVCDIKAKKSHSLVLEALSVLDRLSHRGAVGADPLTGDGAGILVHMPDSFLRRAAVEAKFDLPQKTKYAAGAVFLPEDKGQRILCEGVLEEAVKASGQVVLGWRDVPVDDSVIGLTARDTQPVIRQIFIERSKDVSDHSDFERRLYIIRKDAENRIRRLNLGPESYFYITNLSSRTLVYKGLLMPEQLGHFYPDLREKDFKSHLALVHSRYSTNTFPTWDLSQPFRFLAHNGEINTLRGNINWMRSREGAISCGLFGTDIEKIKPILTEGLSDSAAIDRVFELLVLAGRSMPSAMMMLIPEAWENNRLIDTRQRDFYKYHACLMEPWDGPAAIAFTDGINMGAVLDRNGLRPARYIITKDGKVIMASEAGVLDTLPGRISCSGRLEPGKMLYIDTEQERIIDDKEIKDNLARKKPYGKWLKENLIELDSVDISHKSTDLNCPLLENSDNRALTMMKVFGYTRQDLRVTIFDMAQTGYEPTGSMGKDTPLAVLSLNSQPVYNYFKQLFAQVTNPAIDPIREECVMSLMSFTGKHGNILDESSGHCRKLLLKKPILNDIDLEKIYSLNRAGFSVKSIPILFSVDKENGLIEGLDDVCRRAEQALNKGCDFIVLSDRRVDEKKAAIPALLAVGALHHFLVKKSLRDRIGIVIDSAEPREVFHFALLFGYGADCINPYLAYRACRFLADNEWVGVSPAAAEDNYRLAAEKGVLKILSKMGISTLQSYKGAQIFEALGLSDKVIGRCFCGTSSRIGGAGFDIIQKEALTRHFKAFNSICDDFSSLSSGGHHQWRRDAEVHLWNPESISALQEALRNNDYKRYKDFTRLIDEQGENPVTLRGLLKFKKSGQIPLDEVEPIESIFKRFSTGAMSFGSISALAHETIALAMNKIGARSNTGEGGEDPGRFHGPDGAVSRRSAIKQVASGRFGVTTNYLVNADELQIKIAQGAKPGEGGQLPGHKVNAVIARIRYTTPGVTLISPPPHHDIYSIEDLAQLIFDLKNVNPRARISVKLVSEVGVGTVAAGVAKGHADMILISGFDGGTGASPLSSIHHAGLPWELGLSETHQTLLLNNLRSRVRLQVDGQLRTGRDLAIASMLGAEEYGFATIALVAMGCVMLRHCHLNNCSVGVATQDEILQSRFRGRVEHIVNYFTFLAMDFRETMASLGARGVNELIGRVDLLEPCYEHFPWKAKDLDYSKILYKPKVSASVGNYCMADQDHALDKIIDHKLIEASGPSLKQSKPVKRFFSIDNRNRSVGAMLSGEVCRIFGESGLSEDTIWFTFNGCAGQSFGAWLAGGVTFELQGMANDYVGKGISGGKIIIYPPESSQYETGENILIGNTAFYGAIKGQAYINGLAGERFCVRNSGLLAVVEGVGDHGCEYMTGGRVVILGKTGINFAAGMSGGIAYIYDLESEFSKKCNLQMVELDKLDEEDEGVVHDLIRNHFNYTGSILAEELIKDPASSLKRFVKVMPLEYKRVLEGARSAPASGRVEVSDG